MRRRSAQINFLHKTSYSFHQELLYHGQSLYVPSIDRLHFTIIQELHASPTAGHFGIKATMARLATSLFWPGMYRDTKSYIKQCLPRQHNKPINQKHLGLLQPIPLPNKLWEELTTNFIAHLPSSYGHRVI